MHTLEAPSAVPQTPQVFYNPGGGEVKAVSCKVGSLLGLASGYQPHARSARRSTKDSLALRSITTGVQKRCGKQDMVSGHFPPPSGSIVCCDSDCHSNACTSHCCIPSLYLRLYCVKALGAHKDKPGELRYHAT